MAVWREKSLSGPRIWEYTAFKWGKLIFTDTFLYHFIFEYFKVSIFYVISILMSAKA